MADDREEVDALGGRSSHTVLPPRGVPGRVKPSAPLSESTSDEYNFTHPRRGRAIIINNREFNYELTRQRDRPGTDVDAAALESLMITMGFDVIRYDNMKPTDMSITLREVSKEDHSDADCFVCIILSHGEDGYVYGTSGKIKINRLVEDFKGDNCPTLAGKPKLFFIQACRGTKFDWGADVADSDHIDAGPEDDNLRKIPIEADVLMAYSVVPGYFSWRNNQDGSWFIQAIVKIFRKHYDTMELMQMMTLVNKTVAFDFQSCTDDDFTSNMRQVPCFVSTLTRFCYFRPKYQ